MSNQKSTKTGDARRREKLDVEEVVTQFEETEKVSSNRKGSFKIDASFERALEKILGTRPPKHRHRNRSS